MRNIFFPFITWKRGNILIPPGPHLDPQSMCLTNSFDSIKKLITSDSIAFQRISPFGLIFQLRNQT